MVNLLGAIALEGMYQLVVVKAGVDWSREKFYAKGGEIVRRLRRGRRG